MKRTIFGLIILLLTSSFAFGQEEETEQEIIELSKNKWQWMAEKEGDKLAELFDDKAVFVHMGGS
ncbi:hypothetical protein [Cyclobacterium marinum]|uniref:hypothetical protein n=1 Tax=Cyclobacterium marinum TaxID=104 RepID=UPI0026AC8699|nr:hypothetical protein [Cyclobacterium marinum]